MVKTGSPSHLRRSRHDEARARPFPASSRPRARATAQPEFTGMEWYAAYSERHAADGAEGRLVLMYIQRELDELGDASQWRRGGDLHRGRYYPVQELADGVRRPRSRRRIRHQLARRVAYGGCRRLVYGGVHHCGHGNAESGALTGAATRFPLSEDSRFGSE